jgi:hypothetical protein
LVLGTGMTGLVAAVDETCTGDGSVVLVADSTGASEDAADVFTAGGDNVGAIVVPVEAETD